MPNGADECSDGVGGRWRKAGEANSFLKFKVYSRKYLLELERATGVWECVDARLVEIRHVQVSRSLVGSTCWSWRGQMWHGIALAHGCWSYEKTECRGVL